MANWSNPQLTSTYTNFLAEVKARDEDLAKQFSSGTISNQPTGAVKWDSSANRWKKWSGSAWGELANTYALTALTTTGTAGFGGNITITGTVDASSTVSGTAFIPDGSSVPTNGIYLPSSNTLGFSAGGHRANLNSTGLKLGSGTASCKLDVDGGIKVNGGETHGSHGYSFRNQDTDGGMYSPADNTLTFKTNNERRVSIVGDKIGINETNPATHLHVEGGGINSTNFRLKNNDGYLQVSVDEDKARYQAGEHQFKNQADNTLWATLNSTGLGINKTPAKKLDVSGDAAISGTLTVGSLSGTATKATDLDINASNKILYQAGNGNTSTLDTPGSSDGKFLQSNGAGTPSWEAISTNGEVPLKGVIMWSGSIGSIPTHWTLCDGRSPVNGITIPDLRNKFVVGAWSDSSDDNWPNVAPGSTGGHENAIVVSHNHSSWTHYDGNHGHGVTDPGHGHTYTRTVNFSSGGGDASNRRAPFQDQNAGTTNNGTGISINDGGNHRHQISSDGEAGTNKNLPPYYAIAFIIRTS